MRLTRSKLRKSQASHSTCTPYCLETQLAIIILGNEGPCGSKDAFKLPSSNFKTISCPTSVSQHNFLHYWCFLFHLVHLKYCFNHIVFTDRVMACTHTHRQSLREKIGKTFGYKMEASRLKLLQACKANGHSGLWKRLENASPKPMTDNLYLLQALHRPVHILWPAEST